MEFPPATHESKPGAKIGALITTILKLRTREVKQDEAIGNVLRLIEKEEFCNAEKIIDYRAFEELCQPWRIPVEVIPGAPEAQGATCAAGANAAAAAHARVRATHASSAGAIALSIR